MHNTDAEGSAYFVCDFCMKPWTDELPMVEGHRGSLICGQCVAIAFAELVHLRTGSPVETDETCVLCLESDRPGLHWRSPVHEESIACVRCVKQGAGVLHKDPDYAWTKPAAPETDPSADE